MDNLDLQRRIERMEKLVAALTAIHLSAAEVLADALKELKAVPSLGESPNTGGRLQ